jgi:hypothetical protein
MLFLRSRFCALLAVGVGAVTGCSGGMTIIDTPDGGSGSSSGGSSGGSSSGGSSGGSSSGGGGSCATDADCGAGKMCGFKTADACSAAGTCFDAPGPGTAMCEAYSAGCACDGTEINLACNGYPSGYASRPLEHTGECTGAVDGGAGACSSDADCSASEMCAFKIADACSAVGACIARPAPGPQCAAYSPACTCDNKTINVVCTSYPSGYASAPVSYRGECELAVPDAGSGFACGNTTCDSSKVCKVGMGGVAGSTASYTCVDYPAQCASTHTCACVKTGLGAQQCSEGGGNVTVTFLYP